MSSKRERRSTMHRRYMGRVQKVRERRKQVILPKRQNHDPFAAMFLILAMTYVFFGGALGYEVVWRGYRPGFDTLYWLFCLASLAGSAMLAFMSNGVYQVVSNFFRGLVCIGVGYVAAFLVSWSYLLARG
jgi:hypothetical protein